MHRAAPTSASPLEGEVRVRQHGGEGKSSTLDICMFRQCHVILLSSSLFSAIALILCLPSVFATDAPSSAPVALVGESPTRVVPRTTARSSEDSLIPNYHSLGEIAGHSNSHIIVRCASPVGKIAERMTGPEPTDSERHQARDQMQHLYDLGVRTVISLQQQEPTIETRKNPEYNAVTLEKTAAHEVGLTYVAYPMSNKGKNSLQDMPDDAVFQLVESIGNDIVKRSETGGVAFHCKSGKDRTGLVAAYLRIKYQHWSADQALSEMRRDGHVWKSFLKPGASLSWHEQHLLAIAKRLGANDKAEN